MPSMRKAKIWMLVFNLDTTADKSNLPTMRIIITISKPNPKSFEMFNFGLSIELIIFLFSSIFKFNG